MGTVESAANVNWSVPQIMNLDFPEPAIGGSLVTLHTRPTKVHPGRQHCVFRGLYDAHPSRASAASLARQNGLLRKYW